MLCLCHVPSCTRSRRALASLCGLCGIVCATTVSNASRAEDHSRTGTFVADDGSLRSFRETYREGSRPGRAEPHYVRAGFEMVALIGVGTALYYTKTRDFSHGDYSNAWDRFSRLQVTFDTNNFEINALGHPAAGAMYTLFARTNGLSIPTSFAFSAVSSVIWEMALELQEKPSLNDFVITPVAGAPIGEVLVHLGDYFNSTPVRARWYHEVLGFVFGPVHRLHRAFDGYERPKMPMPADRLGYSSFYTHRFDALAGPMRVANDLGDSASAAQLRFNAELISIPGFLRPGHFARGFAEGDMVEALVQVNIGDSASAWDLLCDANLFGRYAQDISRARSGLASMIAFNSAVRYANRTLLGRPDNYFMAHAGGPAVKLWAVHGDFVARLEGSAHFDLALVRSLAYSDYLSANGENLVPSVTTAHNYYYGFGFSGLARGVLAYKGLELGGRALYGRYDSVDGWDRFPKAVIDAEDRIGELEAWAGITPRSFPVQVRAFVENIHHSSSMGAFATTRWDRRSGVTIGGRL